MLSDLFFRDLLQEQRVHGCRGLKPDRGEDKNVVSGSFFGHRKNIHGRVDHLHASPRCRARRQRLPALPGTRIRSPNVTTHMPSRSGEVDQAVDVGRGSHADRASRSGEQPDLPRKQGRDTIFRDGRRMTPADLHDVHRRSVVVPEKLFSPIPDPPSQQTPLHLG
jgi:hypothetical protein